MKRRNLDLNLLGAFDALMEEMNVSRAAEKMFMTQSAMSHTLNHLGSYSPPLAAMLKIFSLLIPRPLAAG
ncbi:MAG: LysR family transcriptional regulator [Gammaproteobacteria bacterium]